MFGMHSCFVQGMFTGLSDNNRNHQYVFILYSNYVYRLGAAEKKNQGCIRTLFKVCLQDIQRNQTSVEMYSYCTHGMFTDQSMLTGQLPFPSILLNVTSPANMIGNT